MFLKEDYGTPCTSRHPFKRSSFDRSALNNNNYQIKICIEGEEEDNSRGDAAAAAATNNMVMNEWMDEGQKQGVKKKPCCMRDGPEECVSSVDYGTWDGFVYIDAITGCSLIIVFFP